VLPVRPGINAPLSIFPLFSAFSLLKEAELAVLGLRCLPRRLQVPRTKGEGCAGFKPICGSLILSHGLGRAEFAGKYFGQVQPNALHNPHQHFFRSLFHGQTSPHLLATTSMHHTRTARCQQSSHRESTKTRFLRFFSKSSLAAPPEPNFSSSQCQSIPLSLLQAPTLIPTPIEHSTAETPSTIRARNRVTNTAHLAEFVLWAP